MTDLGAPDWLFDDRTRTVVAALEAARPGGARFVGGCVRNTLMGRPVDDIDIATQLRPEETLGALDKAGVRAVPTGLDHGTVTAVSGGKPFEITSLRRDVETDGRRAVVAYTEDWSADAQRRDFRLNAIYAAPDGAVFDPTGGGVEDAKSGAVIFIGDAETRLREDYLRILRFFRFNAWYGAGIDPAGLAACEAQRDGLGRIAAERIWKEFSKLLAAPRPAAVLRAMADIGVLAVLADDLRVDGRARRLEEIETQANIAPEALRRLMSLVPRRPETARALSDRLRHSNAERARLADWAGDPTQIASDMPPPAARAAIYRLGAKTFVDRGLREWSAGAGGGGDEAWREQLTLAQTWSPPEFPLSGADAAQAGIAQGPDVGRALRAAEAWWIAADFPDDRPALLEAMVRAGERRS